MIFGYRRDFASRLWKSAYCVVQFQHLNRCWCRHKLMLYQSNRMHDAVVSKLIAASRGSPCDSMASCSLYSEWLQCSALFTLNSLLLLLLRNMHRVPIAAVDKSMVFIRNKVPLLKSILPYTKSANCHPKCEQQSSVFLPRKESQRPTRIPNSATNVGPVCEYRQRKVTC